MTGNQICYMIDEYIVEAILGAGFVAILGHRSSLCLIALARDIDSNLVFCDWRDHPDADVVLRRVNCLLVRRQPLYDHVYVSGWAVDESGGGYSRLQRTERSSWSLRLLALQFIANGLF